MHHPIWIIFKSEFLRRVRSKAFILATLLAPVGMVALFALPAVFTFMALDGSDDEPIAVVDESNRLLPSLQARGGERFRFVEATASREALADSVHAGVYSGYLVLPETLLQGEGQAVFYRAEGGGVTTQARMQSLVNQTVQDQRLADEEVPAAIESILASSTSVEMRRLTEAGDQADQTFVYSLIGYVLAFTIYFAVFIYGQYVMQGVIEEKSSRVVEIVVSSVRPFQLLMGKVLGIGAMGLVQMITWGVLVAGALAAAGPVLMLFIDPASYNVAPDASQEAVLDAAGITIPSLPLSLLFWTLLFFLGGYLLYASLFAAVGSAVERVQDAQSLMYPVFIPLLIPLLVLGVVIEDPNGTLSTVLSFIPLFAPILMVLRAALTDVATWELIASWSLVALSFVATIWIASRIYRVGIFMYGKPPSLRELLRWITYRP
ncbi:MAG: ABC transporter permease [Longimonas sp.]|uniref:ABC transporter permease n=1 Tax=Longimonas sp. TaxID=2039626 RepID=UPI0033447F19